jgi:hypothetical protein
VKRFEQGVVGEGFDAFVIDIPIMPIVSLAQEVTMTTKNEQPFFARFLEGQEFPEVKTNIKAGIGPITNKFPSDRDEGDQTHKFPSDSDEGDV